ncbi:MAG: hypothetical protein HY912_12395 [Desulfomonile tiedjei]|uniref:Secreted protein n=1 Tax=Desulfomonile tiedjei TaxID=2358 RepID=A0A9D6V5F7_9BACT|nr:hypothetical protein [Desulfomonile tiedjei]
MKIAILIPCLVIALLSHSGCSTNYGPQVVKSDGDSVTVLHQGKKIRIKPDGTTPEKGKGVTRHGIFIYTGDGASSSAMEVRKGLEQSVTAPTEDWTREQPAESQPEAPISQE